MQHNDLLFAAKVAATPLPDESHERYDLLLQAKANAEIQRREARDRALDSLYFFAVNILGYGDFHAPLHKPLCDMIQLPTKQLTLIPRGHFKSTVISVSYPLWLLIKHPDTRILLCNATLQNPVKWIQEQLQHLKVNQVLRWIFPESCPEEERVEQFGFKAHYTVPNRTEGCPWGEASVEVSSIDNNVVSRHYEVIIFDDLVGEENSRTKLGLERTEDFYKNAQALLQGETEGERRWKVSKVHTKLVGTRWHYGDIYGTLIDRGFPSMIRRAIEDGEPIFPTMFNERVLAAKREEMGSTVFSSQMMNDPIDPETAIFKRDYLTYYETVDVHKLNIALTIDPAITEKETADDTAIVVTGVDDHGAIYVLDYAHGKWPLSQTVKEIYRLYERWNAGWVYFEKHGFQAAISYVLHEEGKKRGHFLPVRPVPAKGTKYTRILALQPFHEAGTLRLKRDHTALEDQLTRYPKTRFDDIVDALAMRVQRMIWAEALGAPVQDVSEWSFAAAEKGLDDRASSDTNDAPLINPSEDWSDMWPS